MLRWEHRIILTVAFLLVSNLGYSEENYKGNIVKVTGDKGHWSLTVNGEPYYIKGAGVGYALSNDNKVDFLKLAKEMGANTVRTWGYRQWDKKYLDRAHSYGLLVDGGFWLNPVSPDGTSSYLTDVPYMDNVRQQVLSYVKEYRDHPAILAWNIGNETIYWTKDEKERIGFCKFLEKLIKDVHRLDPYHPVIYTSAYITDAQYILKYVPSLDILGINVYGAVKQTHLNLMAEQTIPIVFTEYGPPGPWNYPKDSNQRPVELNDQEKAGFYEGETKAILENKGYNLGGFAFYLGENSEVTLTLWDVNYGDTKKLSYIKLKDLYTGATDTQQYPFIKNMSLSKYDLIHPGEDIKVEADVPGINRDISYAFMASTEIDSALVENPNKQIPLRFDVQGNKAIMEAPLNPGIYRIYAMISDRDRKYTSTLSRTIQVVPN